MKKKIFTMATMLLLCFVFVGCESCSKSEKGSSDGEESTGKGRNIPLNISVFLDLSDRITRDMTPSQMSRDTAIVGYLADYFKAQTLGPQILQSKNNMKVFFYPTPDISEIATLAEDLSVDMTEHQGKDKRAALESMKKKFQDNLSAIYNKTLQTGKYPGCDIWDFFSSKKVDAQCMREGFRNILVIITDGYLFDENHKIQEGNAYSYVTTTTLKNPNASLIVRRNGLENLEVRILEVNPYDINHRDQLENVLENWLKNMGVKEENITISETSLPTDTRTIMKSFLN